MKVQLLVKSAKLYLACMAGKQLGKLSQYPLAGLNVILVIRSFSRACAGVR